LVEKFSKEFWERMAKVRDAQARGASQEELEAIREGKKWKEKPPQSSSKEEHYSLHSEDRIRERAEILNKFVPDRICPGCDLLRRVSRQWVIVWDKEGKGREPVRVLCRACHNDEIIQQDCIQAKASNEDVRALADEVIVRYRINRRKFLKLCARTGLSPRKIAEACGWSHSLQRRLESGDVKTMDLEAFSRFLALVEERCGTYVVEGQDPRSITRGGGDATQTEA